MKELIYNQTEIPKDTWRYGFRTSAATGCGWIATHNALRLMGYETDIDQLIRYYEKQLPLIHGNAGTSCWGPAVLFRQWGFPVTISLKPSQYDDLAKNAEACILFYYWKKKYKLGAHFVALHHNGEEFIGYNTYTNSNGADHYGKSLSGFLKKRGYFATVLLAIHRKDSNSEK